MTPRRTLAGSIVASLLSPWLVVVVTVLHLSFEHAHDHDVVDRVAAALHGHEHESGTVPHQHDAAPASGERALLLITQMVAVSDSGPVVVSLDPASALPETAKRSPPPPPTASPPILRV